MAERSAVDKPVTRKDALRNPLARGTYREAYVDELRERVLGVVDLAIKTGDFSKDERQGIVTILTSGVDEPGPVMISSNMVGILARKRLVRPVIRVFQDGCLQEIMEYSVELPPRYQRPSGEGIWLRLSRSGQENTLVLSQRNVRFNT